MSNIRNKKIIIGSSSWGKKEVTATEAITTIHKAVAENVREFDSAPHYGNGSRECTLGVALLDFSLEMQQQIQVSTKVGRVINLDVKSKEDTGFKNANTFAQYFDYSAKGILASVEQSRLRLNRQYIDTLYLHDLDKKTHGIKYEEMRKAFFHDGYLAFEELKKQKKIGLVGIGSNDSDACIKLIKDGRFKVDRIMLAGCYNLLNFKATELFTLCQNHNIEIYIAAPYCGGILSDEPGNISYKYDDASPEILAKVDKLKVTCTRFGVSLAHAAMQFVHMHPQVSGVVVGARTPEELCKSLEYARTPINKSFWMALKQQGLIPKNTFIESAQTRILAALSHFSSSSEKKKHPDHTLKARL